MQTTPPSPTVRRFDSPYGPLLVRAQEGVVLALRRWRPDDVAESLGEHDPLLGALAAYFDGDPHRIDVAVEATGTPFQCLVWSAVSDIGWGELTTFAAVAEAIGRPGCARAVGQAIACHPAPLLLGSHRVLSRDGRLTAGDEASLAWATALLRLEGHVIHEGRLIEGGPLEGGRPEGGRPEGAPVAA